MQAWQATLKGTDLQPNFLGTVLDDLLGLHSIADSFLLSVLPRDLQKYVLRGMNTAMTGQTNLEQADGVFRTGCPDEVHALH
jgi:hypothetical protein